MQDTRLLSPATAELSALIHRNVNEIVHGGVSRARIRLPARTFVEQPDNSVDRFESHEEAHLIWHRAEVRHPLYDACQDPRVSHRDW
jgi:hypothetical protein